MDNLGAPTWVVVAFQIPIALVMIFFIIRVLAFIEKIISNFLTYLEGQRELDRQQLKESLGRLADEISKTNVDSIKELASLTQRVDSVIDKTVLLDSILTGKSKK